MSCSTRAAFAFSFIFAQGKDVKSACKCLSGSSVRSDMKYIHKMTSQLHAPRDSVSLCSYSGESSCLLT